MERTMVNSGDLYQLSEELDWQVCRVPRIPNFKPLKKRNFRLSWGSSMTVFFRLFPLYTKIVIYTKKPGWFAIDCKSSGFSIRDTFFSLFVLCLIFVFSMQNRQNQQLWNNDCEATYKDACRRVRKRDS